MNVEEYSPFCCTIVHPNADESYHLHKTFLWLNNATASQVMIVESFDKQPMDYAIPAQIFAAFYMPKCNEK